MKKNSLFKWLIIAGLAGNGITDAAPDTAPENPTINAPSAPPVPDVLPLEEAPFVIAPPDKRHEPLASAIFNMLAGEIAGRRNQIPLAIQHYLDAARLSRNALVAERATRVALVAREFHAGLDAARLWMELRPDNHEALQIATIFHFRTNDAPGTLATLEKLIALLIPKGVENAYEVVAVLLARENNSDFAQTIINQLVERTTERYLPEALFAAGKIHLQNNQSELALQVLDKVLLARPGWVNAIILRARALQEQNRNDLALNYLAEAVKAKPKAHELRLAYGRSLIDEQEFSRARDEFIILARQQPNNGDILFTLGILYLEADQKDQAKRQFTRLLRMGAHTQDANFYLGQIAESANNLSEAITLYRAVREGENYLNAQIRVASLLARKGELTAARTHIHSLDPKDTAQAIRLILVESELLRDAGYLEEAFKILSRAIEELPDNDLLYTRAMIAERLNKINLLEEDLKLILKNDPNHVQALNAMGYTLADRTKRFQEALGYIKRALELRPNDFYILDSMGWVQYRLGHYAEAIRYLQQALALKPDPEVAAHLGEVLWVTGNKSEAQKIWQRALKNTPEAKIVRDTMDRFLKR